MKFRPKEIPTLENQKIMFLDIETTGLDPNTSSLLAIGLKVNKNPQPIIIDFRKKSEVFGLLDFLSFLEEFSPDIIVGHNIMDFDLYYLKEKLEAYGLSKHLNIWLTPEKVAISGTSMNGRPVFVKQGYVRMFNGLKTVPVFDTMIAVAKKDFVTQNLSSYSLKTAVLEWGLRKKERLVLTSEEIYKSEAEDLIEYLKFDLEDTELLFNYLAPEYYYQLRVLPDNYDIQKALLRGNARKWNDILIDYYGYEPEPDKKIKFKGGYTEINPGFYQGNVAKLDISSLYPNIMLEFDYFSRKDPDRWMRQVLEYLTWERLNVFKPKAKQGDKLAKQMSDALKPFINSAYGFLSTSGIGFNDMQTAPKIPAKGRGIVKVMKKDLERVGSRIIEIDTDGIIFQYENASQLQEAQKLFKKHLPARIESDLEFNYKKGAVYAYKAKNYIVFDDKKKPVIVKGLFRKRNRTWYEKNLIVLALKKWLKSDKKAALCLFEKTSSAIQRKTIKPEKLRRCRTIAISEKKTAADLGVEPGSKVCFWITVEKIGKRGKIYYKATKNPEEYDPGYYIQELRKIWSEFFENIGD